KLYRVLGTGKFGKKTEVSELWGDKPFTYLFLVFAASEATGSFTIEELSVTMEAKPEQFDAFPRTEKYNLFDLSSCSVGDFQSYPSGMADYRNSYTGPKEIVEDENGNKGLKIDLTKDNWTANTPTNNLKERGYTPWYGVQVAIPTEYVPYITSINLKMEKQTDAVICFNFGVHDGKNFTKPGDFNAIYSSAATGIQETAYNIVDLYKIANSYYFGWWGKGNDYSRWDKDFTHIYVVLGASQNTGYIVIKELSVTLDLGSQTDIHKDFTTNINAFDLKNAPDGELDCYPAGVSLYNDTYTGTREVVTGASGEKGLRLDMTRFTGNGSPVFANGNYGEMFGIQANIPAPYIPYVKSINLKINKQSNALMCYSFGVTDGTYNSKVTETNSIIDSSQTGKIEISLNPNELYKASRSYYYYNIGAPEGKWNGDFTGLYFNFGAASGATGTITIEEISYTLCGTAEQISQARKQVESTRATMIADFESDGTETVYAAGGQKALYYSVPSTKWNTSKQISLSVENTATPEGLSFWVYNDADSISKQKMILCADGEFFVKRFNVPANSYKKIYIDFNNIALKVGDNWNWSEGEKTSLTLKQRTYLQYVFFTELQRDARPIYYDDFYFSYDAPSVTLPARSVVFTGDLHINGAVTFDSGTAFSENYVAVTPEKGYYIKNIYAVGSDGLEVQLTRQGKPDGQNVSGYYSFIMPDKNVEIRAESAVKDTLMQVSADYSNGNMFHLSYTMEMADVEQGTTFKPTDKSVQKLANYGVIAVTQKALEKYGFTKDDITLSQVKEWQSSKHHLADYVYLLDLADGKAVLSEQTQDSISFKICYNDISINARRSNLVLVTFAEFEDGTAFYERKITKPDQQVYPLLPDKFDPDSRGINYASALQSLSTVASTNKVFDLATWLDIRAQGFEHIRLPINVNKSLDSNGNIVEKDFVKIDLALYNAMKAGLPVVLDLHGFANISSDYDGTKDAFWSVWQQLGERYANLPLSICFEIINEPSVSVTGTADPMRNPDLMELQEVTIDLVRAIEGNSERVFVIGTETNGHWNLGAFTASLLQKGNLIIDVHNYSPMSFSHSGADWIKNEDGTKKYPNGATEFNVNAIANSLAEAAAFEKKTGIPVWVGEFGAYRPNYERKIEYFKVFAEEMFKNHLGWALWEYGAGWTPFTNGTWDTNFLKALGVQ
ncbi:MAG: glycoside hydrolase family 5 protein, partial [Acutalibacteraceae bacterium]